MRFEFRFGLRSLAVGLFYHWQKRIIYLHPIPGFGLVIHLNKEAP